MIGVLEIGSGRLTVMKMSLVVHCRDMNGAHIKTNCIRTFSLHANIMEFWPVLWVHTTTEIDSLVFYAHFFQIKNRKTAIQVITHLWVKHGPELIHKMSTSQG